MDIQMPVLDGYSAVRAIRQVGAARKARRALPIIALTASALDEDVRRANEAGCDMHVSKPVKKSTLLDAIDRAIRAVNESSVPHSICTARASARISTFSPKFSRLCALPSRRY